MGGWVHRGSWKWEHPLHGQHSTPVPPRSTEHSSRLTGLVRARTPSVSFKPR